MKRSVLITASTLLMLTACHRPIPPAAAPPAAAVTTVTSGPELAAAFASAYGQAAPVKRPFNDNDIDTVMTYSPQALIETPGADFLVAQAVNTQDCHACSSGISITTFSVADGKRGPVIATLPFVEGGGGFAESATWHVNTAFTTGPTLFIDGSYSGQCSVTGVQMVELTPKGAVIRSDYIQLKRDDDPGNADAQHIDSRMTPVVRGQSFTIQFSGSFNRTVTYTLKDGKFTPDADISDQMC